ncbi:acyloxyacyl hydrolase [Bosea caraganae]|uniref:Acyloxyacyl hydrolase n=1 Tax=Bosea caraganae TaxID=2763117 RepID=A0A370L2U2_9HYPH|nr:acyloxyacyl hydrolase [Bosea caraganae]RDJ20924.1 acyloxyacyl hydrolase [Bosea caraganae]RDJ22542.1 acyloxyacyl hydrolase [Bosea caraganae]
MIRVALLLLAGLMVAAPLQAQSLPPGVTSYAPATDAPLPSWEARLGIAAANPAGREGGLLNFNGELVTPRVLTLNDRIASAFVPRFHLGSSVNFNGTRFAYAGATWTLDITKTVFVEGSLGAAINDGKTGLVVPEDRLNLGCNAGTREAAALGFKLNDRWSLIASLEHFSTTGCSDRNNPRGPANFGARLGYTF